jgi:type I restriction enzyme R subunit
MPRSMPFIAQHGYLRANQLNFPACSQGPAVMRHGRITRAALSEPPLSRVGRVEAIFPAQDIQELVDFANRLDTEAA